MSSGILNGKKKWFGGSAIVLSAAVAIGGWVWAASANRTATGNQLERCSEQIDDHEARLRKLEDRMARMDINVQWIRSFLEKNDQRGGAFGHRGYPNTGEK